MPPDNPDPVKTPPVEDSHSSGRNKPQLPGMEQSICNTTQPSQAHLDLMDPGDARDEAGNIVWHHLADETSMTLLSNHLRLSDNNENAELRHLMQMQEFKDPFDHYLSNTGGLAQHWSPTQLIQVLAADRGRDSKLLFYNARGLSAMEHAAWVLEKIKLALSSSRAGPFYGRTVDDRFLYTRAWSIIQHMQWCHSAQQPLPEKRPTDEDMDLLNLPQTVRQIIRERNLSVHSTLYDMLLERSSETPELRDRYWQYEPIARLTKEMEGIEWRSLDRDVQIADPGLKEFVIRRDTLQTGSEGHEDGDKSFARDIPFKLATKEDEDAFYSQSTQVNDPRFQSDNYEEACAGIGITPENPRYLSMPRSQKFEPWQPIAIFKMKQLKSQKLKGGLLCDTMGLGKTWVMIGSIYAELQQRQSDIAEKKCVPPAMPAWVVTLPGLVDQCVDELTTLCGREFNIVKYHGSFAAYSAVTEPFTNSHRFFNGDEANAKVIVVTAGKTLSHRHGPIRILRHLTKRGYSKMHAQEIKNAMPQNVTFDMGGCCSHLCIDEAQNVTNVSSDVHQACKMLKSPFTILATGTPDMDRFSDLRGLLQFIEPNEQTVLACESSLGPALAGYNPYSGSENDNVYPHNVLRCTSKYADRFIFANTVRLPEMVKAGTDLLAVCMIRRNFKSIVNGQMIKSRVPALIARSASVEFSDQDFSKYLQMAETPLKTLISKLPCLSYPVYNLESVRELLLFGLWLGFENIHKRYTTKECTRLHALPDDPLAQGFVYDYYKNNGLSLNDLPRLPEGRLKVLLNGAPKMQAILSYINSTTVLRKRNVLVFCSVPAQVLYIKACIAEAGITVESLHAGLSPNKKSDIQKRWNWRNTPMVLLTTPAIGGTGWNFPRGGNIVLYVDPMMSHRAEEQCTGQLYRLGQMDGVESTVFITKGTFNEVQADNEIKEALPGFTVSLDQAFFGLEVANTNNHYLEIKTPPFVEYQEQFLPADDPRVQGLDLEILEKDTLVRRMIDSKIGQADEWSKEEDETSEPWEGFSD